MFNCIDFYNIILVLETQFLFEFMHVILHSST